MALVVLYPFEGLLNLDLRRIIVTKRNALVIGGTSGLGLELASLLSKQDYKVFVTGRHDPHHSELHFFKLELDCETLGDKLNSLIFRLPNIDLLIYAAGFYQESRISDLSDADLLKMTRIGLLAPMLLLQRIIDIQDSLPVFVAVTSTSQWNPKELEPAYCATKAGLGMLARCVSLDERVKKVLVVGVAGMATPFWKAENRDVSTMLRPKWVAQQVCEALGVSYRYSLIKVLRDPPRVETAEVE